MNTREGISTSLTHEQIFNQGWEYIDKSNRLLNPQLFVEAGFDWYKSYQPFEGIPGLWIHDNVDISRFYQIAQLGLFEAAPSNAGKDSIIKFIQDICPNLICPVITATDRPPRRKPNGELIEIPGVDQIFLPTEEFQNWVREGKFIEHQQTRPPYSFGIPHSSINKAAECAKFPIFRITIDGVRTVKSLIEQAYFPTIRIAIIPKQTLKEYKEKLFASGKEHPDDRFTTAKNELYRFGQPEDEFEFILENPWDESGVPHQAGFAFHSLLHAIRNEGHIN